MISFSDDVYQPSTSTADRQNDTTDSSSEGSSEGENSEPSVSTRRGSGRGRGRRGRGRGRGRGHGRRQAPTVHQNQPNNKSYDDPDVGNVIPPFQPSRPTGVHFGQAVLRNSMVTALEFFQLFFSLEMITEICAHTNTYANGRITSGSHQSYTRPIEGTWQETTPDEMKRLIAVIIYFGLVRVSSHVDKYWSTKTLYHGLWARSIIPRFRFRALMAFLHVVDPCNESPQNKLRKVESFLENFKNKCKSLYQPRQNVAIDERMVKSRHRSGLRQYIKDKPTKWGIKLWVLADSSNGYTVDFNVYIGKAAGQQVSQYGLAYDVVMKLIEPYLNQGYHLFFDNFYTSMQLVKDLFTSGTPSAGTIIENRVGFPATLRNGKQWAKKLERGSMRWDRDGPCLAIQWKDNKVVSMITTIDNANDHGQVNRKAKTNNVWRQVSVNQPSAIKRYNNYMNGVDRSDQILATQNVLRKCMRWWKTLFFHAIDIAVVNSFILFKEHQKEHPEIEGLRRPNDYALVNFREELVRQLCNLQEYDLPPTSSHVKPSPPPGQFTTVHMPAFSQDIKRNCVVCYREGRGQKQVHSFCSAPQCQKYLHVSRDRNCFQVWHSEEYHSNL